MLRKKVEHLAAVRALHDIANAVIAKSECERSLKILVIVDNENGVRRGSVFAHDVLSCPRS